MNMRSRSHRAERDSEREDRQQRIHNNASKTTTRGNKGHITMQLRQHDRGNKGYITMQVR